MSDMERRIYLATESAYSTDPSADGSGYAFLPAFSVGDIQDGKTPIPTNWATGRNLPTAPRPGQDQGTVELELPWIGLAAAAGDGGSVPAADWLHQILLHIHGVTAATDGEGVTSLSGTTLTLDDDSQAAQDVVPLFQAGLPTAGAPRTVWFPVQARTASGVYTVPDLGVAFTGDAVAYGARRYLFNRTGGNSLALVHIKEDTQYTLLGCRITGARLAGEAGDLLRLRLTVRYDRRVVSAKASLPAPSAGPAVTPVHVDLCPVFINGVDTETAKFEYDFGLQATQRRSTGSPNGRANDQLVRAEPMISIEPLFSDARRALKANATPVEVLIQLGAGVLEDGVLNTGCIHAQQATAESNNESNDAGIRRTPLELKVSDPVAYGGAAARVIQLYRA